MAEAQKDAEPVDLTYQGGKSLRLPVLEVTEGNRGYGIGSLRQDTGNVSYDPGFMNTANARSRITYIDGEAGILRYRGYPIDELAENATFLEVAWLLIYGELPTDAELAEFDEKIRRHTLLHEDLKRFFSINVRIPRATGSDPTKLPAFRTHLPNFIHTIGELAGCVHFSSVSLSSSHKAIIVRVRHILLLIAEA